MKTNRWLTGLIVCVLLFSTSGCGVKQAIDNLSGPKMEKEVIKSEIGGFEYRAPLDFEVKEDSGFVTLRAPDATDTSGLVIQMANNEIENINTSEELLNLLMSEYTYDNPSEPKAIKIDGHDGLVVDVSFTSQETVFTGQLVAVATPTLHFSVLGSSSVDGWEKDRKVFNKVLANIKFDEPETTSK